MAGDNKGTECQDLLLRKDYCNIINRRKDNIINCGFLLL